MFHVEWVLVDTLNSTLELAATTPSVKKQPVLMAGCFR